MSKIDKLFEGAMKAVETDGYVPWSSRHKKMRLVNKRPTYQLGGFGTFHIYIFNNGEPLDRYEVEVLAPGGNKSASSKKFSSIDAAIAHGQDMAAASVGLKPRTPATAAKPSSAGKRAVKSEIHAVLKNIGGIDQSDWDENPNLMQYVDEAASSFVREYWTNEFDQEEVDFDTVAEAVNEAVNDAVQQNSGESMWKKQQSALESAIERSAERANVPLTVNFTKKGMLEITFDTKAMVRAWAEETEGIGLAAWDPSLKAKDITSAVMVTNILQHRDEVYGGGSMSRTYESEFDRFEPDTGSYYDLKKVADKAYRASLKKKHRP